MAHVFGRRNSGCYRKTRVERAGEQRGFRVIEGEIERGECIIHDVILESVYIVV